MQAAADGGKKRKLSGTDGPIPPANDAPTLQTFNLFEFLNRIDQKLNHIIVTQHHQGTALANLEAQVEQLQEQLAAEPRHRVPCVG